MDLVEYFVERGADVNVRDQVISNVRVRVAASDEREQRSLTRLPCDCIVGGDRMASRCC
jgi:hypothetical protein